MDLVTVRIGDAAMITSASLARLEAAHVAMAHRTKREPNIDFDATVHYARIMHREAKVGKVSAIADDGAEIRVSFPGMPINSPGMKLRRDWFEAVPTPAFVEALAEEKRAGRGNLSSHREMSDMLARAFQKGLRVSGTAREHDEVSSPAPYHPTRT